VENKTLENGFFITLEGPEGAGKSTQASLMADALTRRGYDVRLTREPGGTPLGEELRRLIKHFGQPGAVCPAAELLMFGASRAQLTQDVIRPHLLSGGVLVCDRFADSTTVYQGAARGLDPGFIERMHAFTIGGRWPDLTLLLDLEVATGLRRTRGRAAAGPPRDRIEAESEAFHAAVREGFLQLAGQRPSRVRVIDADASVDEVNQRIMEVVDRALG